MSHVSNEQLTKVFIILGLSFSVPLTILYIFLGFKWEFIFSATLIPLSIGMPIVGFNEELLGNRVVAVIWLFFGCIGAFCLVATFVGVVYLIF
jgi:hypothetical protein